MHSKILQGRPLDPIASGVTIGEFLFEMAIKYHENICQIDSETDATETFGSVKQRSVRVAIELQNRGITPEDVIVFCSNNTFDNIIPVLATTFLGAKVASLDPTLALTHVKHLLSIVTPKIIFVEDSSLDLIENSINGHLSTQIIVIGRSRKYSTLSDCLQPKPEENEFKPIKVDANAAAFLVFSSGTTGLPKAICLSHNNILSIPKAMYTTYCSAILYFTTLYWISAIYALISSFLDGGYRILTKNLDPENIFRIIEKYKISSIKLTPVMSYKLTSLKNTDRYNTRSLKIVCVIGNFVSASQMQKIKELFKYSNVLLGYGMTEAGAISIFFPNIDQNLIALKPGSCGKAVPGSAIKIVDVDTKEILNPYKHGEIYVKSPRVMLGYYRQDASDQFDDSDFLKTGDIGYYDEDECLYIVGRIKEMFKYQSWRIIPTSIECILLEHPHVLEAVVFGIPKEEDGEIPAACVVLKNDAVVKSKELEEFVASRVLDIEKLRGGIKIVNSIPKTPSGKNLRNQMRQLIMKN